jgi:hypothetical protein
MDPSQWQWQANWSDLLSVSSTASYVFAGVILVLIVGKATSVLLRRSRRKRAQGDPAHQ